MSPRRKGKDNILFTIYYALPWWTSLVIGIVLAFIFWPQAASVKDSIYMPKEIQALSYHVLSIFCLVMSVLLSVLLYWRKKKDIQLIEKSRSINDIRRLTWGKFEQLIGQAYRQLGFVVVENEGNGPDGGVDLELLKETERVIVQCKQWRVHQVGVGPIRQLYGVLHHEHATRAIFVTSGTFTAEARDFAKGKPMQLIDGEQLLTLLSAVRSEQNPPMQTSAQPAPTPKRAQPARQSAPTPPACPRCGEKMVMRTAKQGANIGNQFWGCPKYPQCLGKRNMK